METDCAYRNISEDAYDVIAAFTHADQLTENKNTYKEGGRINMCEALTQLIEDGRNEGISIGRNEGISIGRNEGISIGRDEGISIGVEKNMKELIRKKLSKGKSISAIADELEATVGEIERFMEVMWNYSDTTLLSIDLNYSFRIKKAGKQLSTTLDWYS